MKTNNLHHDQTMKTRISPSTLAGLLLLSTLNLQLSTIFAQGTAFTYQGRLIENGSPANGLYDMTFSVFSVPNGGSPFVGPVTNSAVTVSNGLFTTLLDFGGDFFDGPGPVLLEIAVRPSGGGTFITLSPRQLMTPVPHAISASVAMEASSAVNVGNGAAVRSLNNLRDEVTLAAGANVTINTVGNSLQISAPAGGLNLPFSGSASSSGSVFTIANSGAGPAGVFLGRVGIGIATPSARVDIQASDNSNPLFTRRTGGGLAHNLFIDGNGNGSMQFLDATGTPRINLGAQNTTYFNHGNVGIGTTTPQAMLDVRGDIRLGPNGQFRATSGEENLRIVRGVVNDDGTIHSGTGFTVINDFTGQYRITFVPAFASAPAVTASAQGPAITARWSSLFNNRVTISTRGTGDDQNADFSFIAIGPR
jgi:hypothetical protein